MVGVGKDQVRMARGWSASYEKKTAERRAKFVKTGVMGDKGKQLQGEEGVPSRRR